MSKYYFENSFDFVEPLKGLSNLQGSAAHTLKIRDLFNIL